MRNFNNDDEFNDEFGDDFFGRWEKFNERMRDDREFRREMNKFQKDFEEMMRLLAQNRRKGGDSLGMRFIPLSPDDMDKFNDIPEDEMDIEKGEDENGEWETRNWTSPDGSVSYTSFSRSSGIEDFINGGSNDGIFDRPRRKMSPEQEKQLKLAKLNKSLQYCVENEKYEKAAELKKEIDKLNAPTEKTEE